jgi:hypothetical protein
MIVLQLDKREDPVDTPPLAQKMNPPMIGDTKTRKGDPANTMTRTTRMTAAGERAPPKSTAKTIVTSLITNMPIEIETETESGTEIGKGKESEKKKRIDEHPNPIVAMILSPPMIAIEDVIRTGKIRGEMTILTRIEIEKAAGKRRTGLLKRNPKIPSPVTLRMTNERVNRRRILTRMANLQRHMQCLRLHTHLLDILQTTLLLHQAMTLVI